jgi:DNA-3-methyladenine glycosylase
MFGPPGHAYVYLVYGMHACLNVVTEPDGAPAALLVRAVEPLDGLERMRADRLARAAASRRARSPERTRADRDRIDRIPDARLASGPGLVTAAFGLDTSWTAVDLCYPAAGLRLETPVGESTPTGPPPAIVATPRIGIDYAGEPWTSQPWRLSITGHPSVSGPSGRR